jgi:hypothetical protein
MYDVLWEFFIEQLSLINPQLARSIPVPGIPLYIVHTVDRRLPVANRRRASIRGNAVSLYRLFSRL